MKVLTALILLSSEPHSHVKQKLIDALSEIRTDEELRLFFDESDHLKPFLCAETLRAIRKLAKK